MNLPKWALPGGQMFNDPRVAHMRFVTEQAKAYAPDLDEALFFADLLCDGVQYIRDDDDNPLFAPIEVAGEWEVIHEAVLEAERFEDRPRDDQPEWVDPFADDDDDDDDRWADFYGPAIRETTGWMDYIDTQKSKMVADIASARLKGKKWAKSEAFMVAAMHSLDDGCDLPAAREQAFMVYHTCFVENIGKATADGVPVATTKFVSGKRTTVVKVISWDLLAAVQEYLPAKTLLQFSREAWRVGNKQYALELAVEAFAASIT